MSGDSFFDGGNGGDGGKTDIGYVVREYKNCTAFIQQNWTDDLGRDFVRLLQSAEQDLTKFEGCRVALSVRMAEIREKLRILANDDDDHATYDFGAKKIPWSTESDQFNSDSHFSNRR